MSDAVTRTHDLIAPIKNEIRAIRSRARRLLVVERVALIVGAFVAIAIAAGLIDFVVRTPTWFRMTGWFIGIGVLVFAAIRLLLPAFRFAPPETEIALRIERKTPGLESLRDVLASGLELADEADRGDVRSDLVEPVIEQTVSAFDAEKARTVITPSRAQRATLGAAIVALGLIALTISATHLTAIGAQRVLAPWVGAEWPKRTQLADATDIDVHPLGSALPLRALLVKGSDETRVVARYRVQTGDTWGSVRRTVLELQRRGSSGQMSSDTDEAGALFEQLVEPMGVRASEESLRSDDSDRLLEATLEYWFETEDDATDRERITLALPPRVTSAVATIEAPRYLADIDGRQAQRLDLGSGLDERATPEPILAGSKIDLTITLNKPVPIPETRAELDVWLTASLGEDASRLATDGVLNHSFDGTDWTLNWTIGENTRIDVRPVDTYGISSSDEPTFRFLSFDDGAPAATVTQPDKDRSVLPTAVVDVTGEARDDIALDWVAIEQQLAKKPTVSEGAPAEPAGEPTVITRRTADATSTVATSLVVSGRIDIGELDVAAGDEIWLTAIAADAFELDGRRHEPVRSSVRVLRVISEKQLVEQVWQELSAVRRSAIRIDEQQQETTRGMSRAGTAERSQRSQVSISERIARQQQTLDAVRQRIEENGLEDEAIEGILRDASAIQQRAGEASVEATEALRRAAEEELASDQMRASEETLDEAGEAQEQVRDALADLIEMLDQGEDIWTVRRAVERLLSEQESLREQTQSIGEQTTGRNQDQLTPEQREALNEIGERQRSLAERADEAIRDMQRREQEMQQTDPAASEAMAQAARTGERRQASERMRNASEQVDQNQTNAAQAQQEQAIEALEEMLDDLEDVARNRDEVLRRVLSSLIESIRGLVAQQEQQLERLTSARRADEPLSDVFPPLDDGMARLHQNTLAVVDQAAQAPREVAQVARLIERAAEAQVASVIALRDDPIDADEVESQEQISLDRLNEALELAEQLERDAANRQRDRQRDELKAAYRQALEDQVALEASTAALVGREPTRRLRATARGLGGDQAELQDRLARLLDDTSGLRDAGVIAYAHRRLDDATGRASQRLGTGVADKRVTRLQQRVIRVLQSLIEALEEDEQEDEAFREAESGGSQSGGQSGEQPLVPPVAELKMLRSMQQEAADLTLDLETLEGEELDMELEDISNLQDELAEEGTKLLERLSNPGPVDIEPDPGTDEEVGPPGEL